MLNLTGKRALVAGASRGIGRAAAEALARQGAAVTLLARDGETLSSVHASLPVVDGRCHHWFAADFMQLEPLRELVQKHVQEAGGIDILVNNSGGPPPGPAIEADVDAYAAAFTQHLLCNQTLAQVVTPHMREQVWGRIINVISTSVIMPIGNLGVSNTIRGAVGNWSRTLARELAPDGVTVNNVLPGFTITDRLKGLIAKLAERQGKTEQEIADAIMATVPAQRFAQPGELADLVVYLASDEAGYINGVSIPVDGGRLSAQPGLGQK